MPPARASLLRGRYTTNYDDDGPQGPYELNATVAMVTVEREAITTADLTGGEGDNKASAKKARRRRAPLSFVLRRHALPPPRPLAPSLQRGRCLAASSHPTSRTIPHAHAHAHVHVHVTCTCACRPSRVTYSRLAPPSQEAKGIQLYRWSVYSNTGLLVHSHASKVRAALGEWSMGAPLPDDRRPRRVGWRSDRNPPPP